MERLSALSKTVSSYDGWGLWFCDGGIQARNRVYQGIESKDFNIRRK
jgi:hypothetical protein